MKHRFIATIAITLITATTVFSQNIKHAVVLKDVEKQTDVLLQEVAKVKNTKPDLASPRTVENGELKMVSSRDWTSGFFPGAAMVLV